MPRINGIMVPTTETLMKTLSAKPKLAANVLKIYENEDHFAEVRFTQDMIVNWVPKVPFTRSLADFSDMSFLEISENFLVYYGGKFLNDKIFKKVLLRKATPELEKHVATPAIELIKNNTSQDVKKAISIKAALAVCGLAIPLAEYSLSYVKNLFTLKIFKQADFNNIANLNKTKTEDIEKQKLVKESAKKHIKLATAIFAGCLFFAALLATKGKNSKSLQSISEAILAPGSKFFKNNPQKERFFNKYFGLDSSKLTRGSLVTCVLAAFIGYSGAAKDRGKQNFLEVLYRFPLVGFYVVTGNELIEAGFKKLLIKHGKCKEILEAATKSDDKELPKMDKLSQLASELASKKILNMGKIGDKEALEKATKAEFKKLISQKLTVMGIPLLFGLTVMGFFVAGMSRFFTQYRYNKEQNELQKQNSKINK